MLNVKALEGGANFCLKLYCRGTGASNWLLFVDPHRGEDHRTFLGCSVAVLKFIQNINKGATSGDL